MFGVLKTPKILILRNEYAYDLTRINGSDEPGLGNGRLMRRYRTGYYGPYEAWRLFIESVFSPAARWWRRPKILGKRLARAGCGLRRRYLRLGAWENTAFPAYRRGVPCAHSVFRGRNRRLGNAIIAVAVVVVRTRQSPRIHLSVRTTRARVTAYRVSDGRSTFLNFFPTWNSRPFSSGTPK